MVTYVPEIKSSILDSVNNSKLFEFINNTTENKNFNNGEINSTNSKN